jgi:iron complex transport system substrate-binding protein
MKSFKISSQFSVISFQLFVFGLILVLFAAAANAMEGPKRIISLAPSITESLYQLGMEDNLIGVTTYCDYPPRAKEKPKIGTLINPNIEKIVSLSPDLILTIKDVNRLQTMEKLKNLGLNVFCFQECASFNDITKNFLELSTFVNKEPLAEEIIKKAKERLQNIAQTKKINDPTTVFWQVNAKPLVTVGKNTFTNNMIELCGGTNIFKDITTKYPRINCEEILLRNPEVIILVTMGDVTEAQRAFWQKFNKIDAVRDNRIYVVDANLVCRPTVSSFLAGIEKITNILNNE